MWVGDEGHASRSRHTPRRGDLVPACLTSPHLLRRRTARRSALKQLGAAFAVALGVSFGLPFPAGLTADAKGMALDLLRLLARKDAGKTVVMSPLSVEAALALLAEGAAGETQGQIRALAGEGAPAIL